MRTITALALTLTGALGCSGSSSVAQPDGGGYIFDPCVRNPAPGYDPASHGLTACCVGTGAAHCVPATEVLPALASQLNPCTGSSASLCLPDPIIHAGGSYAPGPCTSSVGHAAGVCLSQCIPLVANNPQSSVLGQDGCGDGELCVPCKNPFNGMSTGACNLNELLCSVADGGVDGGDGGGGMCPYTGPPLIDPTTLAACAPACGGAHCLPANLVPAAEHSLLGACTAKNGMPGLCAPDPLIASGGNYVAPTCVSVAGAEGRCVSTCLPSVAAQAAQLPQDVCKPGEKCAPCYNPIAVDPTMPTGACSVACDHPTKPPIMITCPWTGPPLTDPATFPDCAPACSGAHCVPAADVPTAEQPLLAACPGGFCAPDPVVAAAGHYVPPTCVSVAGAEGRCLSTCLPLVAAQAALLPQSTCEAGTRCVPCFNPTAADPTAPTGACSLACDRPTQPPVVLTCPWTGPAVVDPASFPDCAPVCGGAHCIPKSMVPAAQQAILASCNSGNGVCAPDAVIQTDNNYVPPSCNAFNGTASEGRCTSTCIPSVAAQASELHQHTCAAGDRCAPCFDPFTGVDTGACRLACDQPQNPPFTFPGCCVYNGAPTGTCVPLENVPANQQSNLQQGACPTNAYDCVPDENLPGASGGTGCTGRILFLFPYSGTCISNCVKLGLGTIFPQGDCADGNHTCIPCNQAPAGSPGC